MPGPLMSKDAPSLRRDSLCLRFYSPEEFKGHSKPSQPWVMNPKVKLLSRAKGVDAVALHVRQGFCQFQVVCPLWGWTKGPCGSGGVQTGCSVTSLSNSRIFIGLSVRPPWRKKGRNDPFPTCQELKDSWGGRHTHKILNRETVICAKKDVREEEMNFPWTDPRKHLYISVSISSLLNNQNAGKTFA